MAVKITKVVGSLPVTLDANALYLVRTGAGFDLYVADSTGTTAHALNAPASASTTGLDIAMRNNNFHF